MAANGRLDAEPDAAAAAGSRRWGRTVVQIRWLVLAAALVVAVLGVAWGSGVFDRLITGGFDDPGSESAQASERIAAELGRDDADVVVLYSGAAGVDDPSFRSPVTQTVQALRHRPEVAKVVSFYDTRDPALVSRDGHATYAAVTLNAADDDAKRDAYDAVRPALSAPGVTSQVGGVVAFQATADELTRHDLARAEKLALPAVLVLLILVFGGVVAAGLPLLIGILGILGALTATRLMTTVTDVSTFAVNTITLLSLGMAIDYSLFVVNRFREELRAGLRPPAAVARTMSTAGRTVLVSGLTVTLALASLLIFPQVFLRSMALGGMAAVLVAMTAALSVLPAMLVLLGRHVDAWRVPLPWSRRRESADVTGPDGGAERHGAWARLASSVMRRPVRYLVAVLAVLAVAALPFAGARFGGTDERAMPAGTESRVVAERVAADFPGGTVAPINLFVAGGSAAQLRQLVGRIRELPGVEGARVTAERGQAALVTVGYPGQRTDDQARRVVRAVRALPKPAGVEVLVGGRTAADIDRLDSLSHRLPWMGLIMAGATLILLFLAFGSVLLPIKAVVMNLLSIGASFGVLVWVFQDGHLAGWLGITPTGFLEPTIPILILAVLFGLATDYEVFLLSRVREAWDAGASNTASVATGLQRTGRIITAAALLLVVVVAGFTTGDVMFAKMIGVGMIVAITVDATLVRALLVPATMRLIGRWNWWSPRRMAALYHRFNLREQAQDGAQHPSHASGDCGPRQPAVVEPSLRR